MGVAGANFCGEGLVFRGEAADCVGHPAIVQLHDRIGPAAGIKRLTRRSKTKAMECRVQQLTGHVYGEWTAGAVCPSFARPQAKYKQLGIQRPKGGNR